ncbi:MAG: glycosyltransferase [Rhodospirillales bacterium]
MLRASILIPTHVHASTLKPAVSSVQAQGGGDIEILIVGDGASDGVRSAALALAADDSRIRFFDFPKGPRHGEVHRHAVLQQARGRIVCYQSDDDLWLPNHLDAMEAALMNADFAGAMHVDVDADGRVRGYYCDLERPEFKTPFLEGRFSGLGQWANGGFGLTFAAHRLDAYRRLPQGWATAPQGQSTEHCMWRKFLSQPWCRVKILHLPIALHFSAPERADWTGERRAEELRRWMDVIALPGGTDRICQSMLEELGERLVAQKLAEEREQNEAARVQARKLADERDRGEEACRQREAARRELEGERALRRIAEARRDAVLRSTFWRLTGPLRAATDRVKSIRFRRDP